MFISKSINPFGDIDMNMYYGMSTGDHILGIFRDFSATNSCISVLGFVYFLFQRKYWLSILCLIVVLITTSNINIAILVATIISLFIFYSNRFLKTLIICFIAIVVVFFIRISPNNLKYFADKLHINFDLEQNKNVSVKPPIDLPNGKEQKALTDAEKKDLAIFHKLYTQELLIEKENERNRYKIDSLFSQQQFDVGQRIVNYSRKIYGDSLESVSETKTSHDYGKILSFQETLHYLFSSPSRFILGAGAGQYSSKLAFKVSGIGVYGNFPLKYQYVSEEFKNNHLRILTYYFIQPPDKHSATNTPYSVFNQILGEYGILGFALFVFFYVFFFLKRFKLLSYGKVLLPIMLLFFVTDYWFENLSVVIIFELLMLLDMATTTTLNNKNDSSISQ